MNEYPFQKFIELVAYDQELNKLEQEMNGVSEQLNRLQSNIAVLEKDLQAFKEARDEQKRIVDTKELEMNSLQAEQKAKETKLESITHPKEYQSLMTEITAIKQKQYNFEPELLAAWQQYENAMRLYEAKKKEIDAKIVALNQEYVTTEAKYVELQKKFDEYGQLRPAKTESIPQEWLDKYALMRKSVTNPVVPVAQESCSACFYPVNRQDLIRLQKRQLVPCKACFRFLYLKEAHEAA